MTVFGRQIELAQRMVGAYGQRVRIERPGAPETGSLATPGPATASNVWAAVPMVFLKPGSESFKSILAMLGGTEVPVSGVKALMAPHATYVPNYRDIVFRDSMGDVAQLAYDPKNGIEVLAPDGTPVLWFLRFQG